MKAPQNQSDVDNEFGDRDFALAVCTRFIRKGDRFEANNDFRLLKNGRIDFPVDGSLAERQ
jgi:hypothetical protein